MFQTQNTKETINTNKKVSEARRHISTRLDLLTNVLIIPFSQK